MAIPGKFETTRIFQCMECGGKRQNILAHSPEWTGDIRTDLRCTTPGCTKILEDRKTKNRVSKGNLSTNPHVDLLTLLNGERVVLEEYECSEDDARHCCDLFRDVLSRIPTAAREAILAHWMTGRGSPHVWLLKNRSEWGGNGWAMSRNRGLSLCVVSTLIRQIPDEHIRTAIAHEFGHTLFVAGGEPHHVPVMVSPEALCKSSQPDPLRMLRPEWLVWRLMEAWGFDQPAMEEWMERNMIDDASGVRIRDQPLTHSEFQGKCIAHRNENEAKLKDMIFPAEFERYLKD